MVGTCQRLSKKQCSKGAPVCQHRRGTPVSDSLCIFGVLAALVVKGAFWRPSCPARGEGLFHRPLRGGGENYPRKGWTGHGTRWGPVPRVATPVSVDPAEGCSRNEQLPQKSEVGGTPPVHLSQNARGKCCGELPHFCVQLRRGLKSTVLVGTEVHGFVRCRTG